MADMYSDKNHTCTMMCSLKRENGKNASTREQRSKNRGPWLPKRALSVLAMRTWAECHIYLHLSQWIYWKLSPLQFRVLEHAETLQYTLRLG